MKPNLPGALEKHSETPLGGAGRGEPRLLRTAVLLIPLDLERVQAIPWEDAGIAPTFFTGYLRAKLELPPEPQDADLTIEAVIYVISHVATGSTMFQAMTIDAERVFPHRCYEWVLNLDGCAIPEGAKRLRTLSLLFHDGRQQGTLYLGRGTGGARRWPP